jgi:hypothetical protein
MDVLNRDIQLLLSVKFNMVVARDTHSWSSDILLVAP